jgi:DNA-binding transcriptional LysR family regulator
MSTEPRRPDPGLDALELRQLRHFVAVAEERSFTRAAARLSLAQQGLSASIARLEDQLGVRLLTRTTRRVEPTPAGEILLADARAVIEAAERALARVRLAAEGRAGRLAIGFSTAAGGVGVVRELIRSFATAAPDVDLRTIEHDFTDPAAGLLAGTVGVAFVFGPAPGEGVESLTLVEERRLLATTPEHPLAARESVDEADLRGLPWLQVPAAPGAWVDSWFPRRAGGLVGPVIRTADEWVTAIETGRGVAYTLPSVMRNFGTARIAVTPVEGGETGTVLLAWRTGDDDPLVRAFVASASASATRP